MGTMDWTVLLPQKDRTKSIVWQSAGADASQQYCLCSGLGMNVVLVAFLKKAEAWSSLPPASLLLGCGMRLDGAHLHAIFLCGW